MNYRVVWDRWVLRALSAIWLGARDRTAVTRAANIIERLLMLDPHHEGRAMRRDYRSLFVTPLTVKYHIDDQNWLVTIVGIRFGDKTP